MEELGVEIRGGRNREGTVGKKIKIFEVVSKAGLPGTWYNRERRKFVWVLLHPVFETV